MITADPSTTTAPGNLDVVLLNNSEETFSPSHSGAIATCLWELCRAAEAQGRHPTVLTRGSDHPLYEWSRTQILRVPTAVSARQRVLRKVGRWRHTAQRSFARAAIAEIKRLGPDIVVCNNDPEVAATIATRFPDVAVIHVFHNLQYSADGWAARYRAAARTASLSTVGVSKYVSRAIESAYLLPPLSVRSVHNGVDATRFRPRETPQNGLATIGFVGRMGVEKAPDVLLEAAARLARHRTDFRLRLVGAESFYSALETQYGDELSRRIAALEQSGIEVTRRGHVGRDALPAEFDGMDVLVVPSRWDEPFGLVALEGMASGIPVIATAGGGLPEVLGDCGTLVPRDDPDALANALARLLDASVSAAQRGAAGRARAVTMTWAATWSALVEAPWR